MHQTCEILLVVCGCTIAGTLNEYLNRPPTQQGPRKNNTNEEATPTPLSLTETLPRPKSSRRTWKSSRTFQQPDGKREQQCALRYSLLSILRPRGGGISIPSCQVDWLTGERFSTTTGHGGTIQLVLGHMITSFCGNGRPRYEWPGRQWHSLPALSRHSTHWSPPEKATSWQLLSLERQTLLLCDLVTWLLFSRCTVALGRAAKKTPSAIGLALQHLLESRT